MSIRQILNDPEKKILYDTGGMEASTIFFRLAVESISGWQSRVAWVNRDGHPPRGQDPLDDRYYDSGYGIYEPIGHMGVSFFLVPLKPTKNGIPLPNKKAQARNSFDHGSYCL